MSEIGVKSKSIFGDNILALPNKWIFPIFSDELSLRLGPGSTRAWHLEGLFELGFCRLDPSIGWVKPKAQASGLRPQAWARLELGIRRLDPSLPIFFLFVETTFELRFKKAIKSTQSTISYTTGLILFWKVDRRLTRSFFQKNNFQRKMKWYLCVALLGTPCFKWFP